MNTLPKYISFLIFLCYGLRATAQPLVINEMMSSNATSITDEDGDYEDWIELYNNSDEPINLQGYHLSDSNSNRFRWQFPAFELPAGAYLIVFASGKDRTEGPCLHTNFSISASGEPLYLMQPDSSIGDYYSPVSLATDYSFGRQYDGHPVLITFSTPTPGTSNNLGTPAIALTDAITPSHSEGYYSQPFDLHLTHTDVNATIHYTTNGSEPTAADPLYTGPIHLKQREGEPNNFSMIPTNVEGTWYDLGWKIPDGDVFKIHTLRVRSFIDGTPASPLYSFTYFVHPLTTQRYAGLPVISIITDSLHFFGHETGIYVPGLEHELRPDIPPVEGHGNYVLRGIEWERPAHLTLLETDGSVALSQEVGVRIHGGASRLWPVKSLRIFARNRYGKNTLDHAIFPWKGVEQYRRLLLRNSGNDFFSTYLTDAVASLLLEGMDMDKQAYRPAVVFVNGEYWGIHNLRDHLDENYLAYTHDVAVNEVDIVENWREAIAGSYTDFEAMMNFVANNDLAEEAAYDILNAQLDMENVMNYFITKQYLAVKDWPGNNLKMWRAPGGKWRFMHYDNDGAFVDYQFDAIRYSMEPGPIYQHHDELSIRLFSGLMRNDIFRKVYQRKFEHYLGKQFAPDRIIHLIDSVSALLSPVMEEHIARWGFPYSMQYWEEQVDFMRDFAERRPCAMYSYLNAVFHRGLTTPHGFPCDTGYDGRSGEGGNGDGQLMHIWPNPATDLLNVAWQNDMQYIEFVAIYDLTGRRLSYRNESHNSQAAMQLDVAALPPGAYILATGSKTETWHRKFVVFR